MLPTTTYSGSKTVAGAGAPESNISTHKTSPTLPNSVHTSGINPPHPTHIKINYSDIEDELKYWESAVICYILGANPPLNVIEGFVKRIWNTEEIDKIGSVAKGIYIVHMKSKDGVNIACESNGILFDKKPFVVRPWTKNISFEKENLNTIPIWVSFPGIECTTGVKTAYDW